MLMDLIRLKLLRFSRSATFINLKLGHSAELMLAGMNFTLLRTYLGGVTFKFGSGPWDNLVSNILALL